MTVQTVEAHLTKKNTCTLLLNALCVLALRAAIPIHTLTHTRASERLDILQAIQVKINKIKQANNLFVTRKFAH